MKPLVSPAAGSAASTRRQGRLALRHQLRAQFVRQQSRRLVDCPARYDRPARPGDGWRLVVKTARRDDYARSRPSSGRSELCKDSCTVMFYGYGADEDATFLASITLPMPIYESVFVVEE